MADEQHRQITPSSLTVKTVIVHTVTYVIAGILAYNLGGYEEAFSRPPLSCFMRPTSDPWIMTGPLFQPLRGIIFALALYPFREVIVARRGWLKLWWLLLALGVFSTFGPAPGSVEGLVYTVIPLRDQLVGLWEVVLQSFLLAIILWYWLNHPEKRWFGWTLGAAFALAVALPVLGILSSR